MPHRLPNVALLATLLMMSACRPQVMPTETAVPAGTPDDRPVATLGPDEAVPGAMIALDPVVIVPVVVDRPVALVDAAAMKQALDADGRIALRVDFETDKATLRPDAAPVISEITDLLEANPGLRLSIDGHADANGDAARSRELSRARAEAVREALIDHGIDGGRLQTQGLGAARPAADNDSIRDRERQDRARNRRLVLVKLG